MKYSFIGFIIIITFFSCSEDNTAVIGENWVNTNTKIFYIDSITVKSSTFKFDTLSVTAADRLLIGAYNDPVFGRVKSKSYLQLTTGDFTIEDNSATYDSIVLILKYDKYVYNDTLPQQQLNIYKVLDDIEPDPDSDNYYNTTEIQSETTPLTSLDFLLRPYKTDSLDITLNHDFGEHIFDEINENNINSSLEFLNEFKGLLIEAGDENTAIFGITKNSYLRMYYSVNNEIDEDSQKYIDFTLNEINSFSNIKADHQNTLFQSLQEVEDELPSTETDNNSFIEAGVGIATKIDIPYIERINDIRGTGAILTANLKLTLKRGSNTDLLKTRDSLKVYIIDNKFNIISDLYTDGSAENIAYAQITNESDEFNTITYSLPIIYFLNIKQNAINSEKYYLSLYSQDFNQSTDRYIFYGEKASSDVKLKVELIYAVYDE